MYDLTSEVRLPAPIKTLFWDIGGVLLTNAWDRGERHQALDHFHVDEAEFAPKHEAVLTAFEEGRLDLDDYLDQTIFFRPRDFNKSAFKEYIFPLSRPKPDMIDLAKSLARSGKYRMATLNNESRDFNLYRIQTFGLREIFTLFVSSCFVGLRKPDAPIFKLAIEITQAEPAQCCFIDDRAKNLEAPRNLGMSVIECKNAEQVRQALSGLGVIP